MSESRIRASDGVALAVRDWRPDPSTATVASALIVHGLGEHSGRYAHVAAALTALGVAVRSYDQRGFGASDGARGRIPHPDALLDDARLVFDALAAERRAAADATPPFLIGHSMGGAVAARAATGKWVAPRGLVLSSPALRTRLSAAERMAASVGDRVMPNIALPHRLPLRAISRDPAVYAAMKADALCHDLVSPRVVRFIEDAGAAAIRDASTFDVPTLLLVAGDDRLVDPAGARAFADAMPPGRCTVRWYEGHYHEVFNEREPERGRVLDDLRTWVAERVAAG